MLRRYSVIVKSVMFRRVHCYCYAMYDKVLLLCYGGYIAVYMLWQVQCNSFCNGGYSVIVIESILLSYGGYSVKVMLRRVQCNC